MGGEGLGALLQTPGQFREVPCSGGPHQTRERSRKRVRRASGDAPRQPGGIPKGGQRAERRKQLPTRRPSDAYT